MVRGGGVGVGGDLVGRRMGAGGGVLEGESNQLGPYTYIHCISYY